MASKSWPVDTLGREIHAGDYIAYPNRTGSALWIRVAKVREVKFDAEIAYLLIDPKRSSNGDFKDTKNALLTRVDRCVIIRDMDEGIFTQEV